MDLDGRSLKLFLTVLEEGSVTKAAGRLNLTQSAVSHALARLNRIVGEPLFVKSGRRITATARAHAMAGPARDLLDGLRATTRERVFDPASAKLSITIAANDLQRDLLLPAAFRRLTASLAELRLRVVPSRAPSAAMLREERCDLLITPLPPKGADIMQRLLLEDEYVCYFDGAHAAAPASLEDYLAARHVTVVYSDDQQLSFDKALADAGVNREIFVSVPHFSGVPAFLRASRMIASLPGFLHGQALAGFQRASLPAGLGETYGRLPMFLVWHHRHHDDPAHIWLRNVIGEVAHEVAAKAAITELDETKSAGQNG
jgi:DNA-binding transcriptional LysR family regulator